MNVIKVEHIRCNETESYSYYVAPDNMSHEEIVVALEKAQDDYLKAIEEAGKSVVSEAIQPPYGDDIPDSMTYGEHRRLDREWRDVLVARRQAQQKQNFYFYLKAYGFLTIEDFFYDNDKAQEIPLDWGHRHGLSLNY